MNWLPTRKARGNVTTRNKRFSKSVVLRYRRQARSTGRYRACVQREKGLVDSGRSCPRMKISMRTGTRVTARIEENATAKVFVHARGRNIRPSWASSRKTGKKE